MPRIQPRTSAQVGPMMGLAYWYADNDADAVTTTPVDVDDALVARLRDAFGVEPTVGLTATIALDNQRARFNHALGLHAQGHSPDVFAARASALALQDGQVT